VVAASTGDNEQQPGGARERRGSTSPRDNAWPQKKNTTTNATPANSGTTATTTVAAEVANGGANKSVFGVGRGSRRPGESNGFSGSSSSGGAAPRGGYGRGVIANKQHDASGASTNQAASSTQQSQPRSGAGWPKKDNKEAVKPHESANKNIFAALGDDE